jgi:hypothetical protein
MLFRNLEALAEFQDDGINKGSPFRCLISSHISNTRARVPQREAPRIFHSPKLQGKPRYSTFLSIPALWKAINMFRTSLLPGTRLKPKLMIWARISPATGPEPAASYV